MATDQLSRAALALHRFGLGPRPGSMKAIAADPKGALLAELEKPGAGLLSGDGLLDSGAAARADYEYSKARDKINLEMAESRKAAKAAPESAAQPDAMKPATDPVVAKLGRNIQARLYYQESDVRVAAAVAAETGIVERLVWFWSNHFCIDMRKAAGMPGAYEREAIRPHVLGQFADMLRAVEGHPAMLRYLDNTRSIGPHSRAGAGGKHGLNENLAREILELHTLGVRTGYTQVDVTNLAKIITGWTTAPFNTDPVHGGEFQFNPNWHEPGPQTVLGKVYPDAGVEQGRAVLADLASHPTTASHLANKLAVHFVSDTPPRDLVERLSKRFIETGGDLKEVTKTLLQSHEAWEAPRAKFKRPTEWMIGALRAMNADPKHFRKVARAQMMLGEPLWRPASPKGFPDQSANWTNGLGERLDVVNHFAREMEAPDDPLRMLDDTLGPLASAETRSAVARASDRTQALTLLFMAPEFQMR